MRFFLVMICLCAGCAAEKIPIYPLMSGPQTLELLRTRSQAIKTISGQGTLRLTRPDGQSINFDLAIAIQPTDRARIRTWKFGQAIFDLTLTPDGLFVIAPKDSAHRDQINAASSGAAAMIRRWMQLISGLFGQNEIQEHGNELIVKQNESDGATIICTLDRRTITARSYRLLDKNGIEQFSLTLDHYVESNGQIWPRRIDANSETGKLRIDLRDIEVNDDIPTAAFEPPKRAEKLP